MIPLLLIGLGCVAAVEPPTGLLADLVPAGEVAVGVSPAPSLSWIVPAGTVQAAYRIQVASRADLLDRPDAWDSGEVASDRSVAVPYGGRPLAPGSTWWWRVAVRDQEGRQGPPSAAAPFTIAEEAESWPRRALATVAAPPVTATAGAVQVLDFGRDAFGWLEATVTAPAAATVRVVLGEQLRGDGRVERKPTGCIRAVTTSLAVAPGRHTYRVEFPADRRNTGRQAVRLPPELGVVTPFRYAELEGLGSATASCVRMAVQYPFDAQAARFVSGDPTLDAVWELCRYSIQATSFAGLYVDGDRERIPYEADAWINQLGHYAADREFAMARATYGHLLDHPTWPTEWAQCMALIAWQDWMHTGDLRAVARTWDRLVARSALRNRIRPDGLVDTKGLRDIVDWPGGERDGYDMTVTVNTVVNAFHIRAQWCLADLAQALGRQDEARSFRDAAARAKGALNSVLVDPATGLYRDGAGSTHSSLHANMVPLAFGLVPEERRAAVAAFVKGRGMACSVYGAQFLLDGLFAAGEDGAAIALMTARGPRSWWDMMTQGSTITLEAWNPQAKGNLDWNHAWGAAPANVIPRHILGIQPLEPGGSLWQVRPRLGSLRQVAGTVPTIRGPLSVTVRRLDGGGLGIDLTVPGNTRARVDLGAGVQEVGPGRHILPATAPVLLP